MNSWIGVDLDGTLAHYESGYSSHNFIGKPIPLMVQRVKFWLSQGIEVRLVTARVTHPLYHEMKKGIEDWLLEHVGQKLQITNCKDYGMVQLWDDRCVQVIPNTGKRADGKEIALIP